MSYPESQAATEEWVARIFAAKAATTGGVVRRRIADVEAKIGLPRLRAEVAHRGFRLIEAGDQYIIVCTTKPMRVHV